jgi:hypothetical protein
VNADVRLWRRVEICRAFVLSELRRILLFEQNRVEMRFPVRKRVILVSVRWGLIACFLRLLFLGPVSVRTATAGRSSWHNRVAMELYQLGGILCCEWLKLENPNVCSSPG